MLTVADFCLIYPEFSSNTDEQIELYIDMFTKLYGEIGEISDHLQGLYTAHRLYMNNQGALSVGNIKSRSVGDVSTSYGGVDKSSEFYTTKYGSEFYDLLMSMSGAVVANAI